ncbi:hypothetical protein HPB47_008281 [Ixodes persulcatus]|uniref:Uncharacterized protein n=1 Tax=Ixodes persulcatus TaxID=34615 RepID=A0AC60P5A8_IXOPE|nr:hypothetical protein HPB47_008281 [Ixodes persulcatus]
MNWGSPVRVADGSSRQKEQHAESPGPRKEPWLQGSRRQCPTHAHSPRHAPWAALVLQGRRGQRCRNGFRARAVRPGGLLRSRAGRTPGTGPVTGVAQGTRRDAASRFRVLAADGSAPAEQGLRRRAVRTEVPGTLLRHLGASEARREERSRETEGEEAAARERGDSLGGGGSIKGILK